MEYCPYYDADTQAKIKAELGQDKMLVFNEVSGMIHIAEKVGSRYLIDISADQGPLRNLVHEMEEGKWELKSS